MTRSAGIPSRLFFFYLKGWDSVTRAHNTFRVRVSVMACGRAMRTRLTKSSVPVYFIPRIHSSYKKGAQGHHTPSLPALGPTLKDRIAAFHQTISPSSRCLKHADSHLSAPRSLFVGYPVRREDPVQPRSGRREDI